MRVGGRVVIAFLTINFLDLKLLQSPPNVQVFTDKNDAIDFLFPNSFDTPDFNQRVILTGTNSEVDQWNNIIQKLNPNNSPTSRKLHHLYSYDVLAEVDDPHDILKEILTPEVLNRFHKNNVPPNILTLCVGDVCIILRNLSKRDALTNNTRVRILSISKYCIHVQTLGSNPVRAAIPRIRFKFRLPFGESYQLRRTQFPLRLAYSMSLNKAQGQELKMALLDLRKPVFAHGHLYVGLSRVREATNIAIFTTKDSLLIGSRLGTAEDGDILPVTTNVIYPELLLPTNISTDQGDDDNEVLDRSMMLIASDYNEAEDENIFMI